MTPRRDRLEGLIGGLLLAQDAPQVTQVGQQEPAAAPQPEQQGSATSMVQEPPAQPSDVCARQGLRRIYYPKIITVTGAAQVGDNFICCRRR